MNTIRLGAGGAKGKEKQRRGGPSLASAAKQLGLDEDALGNEAKEMWEMLDQLSASDPVAYQKFVQDQASQAKAEDSKSHSITPTPGFTVFGETIKRGGNRVRTRVYVNCCSHKLVERPSDKRNVQVAEESRDVDGLMIPLAISEPRSIVSPEDQNVMNALVVDVIVNPWVLARARDLPAFKAQLVELARDNVQDELGLDYDGISSGGSHGMLRPPVITDPFLSECAPMPLPIGKQPTKEGEQEQQEEEGQSLFEKQLAQAMNMVGANKNNDNGGLAGMTTAQEPPKTPGDLLRLVQEERENKTDDEGCNGYNSDMMNGDLGIQLDSTQNNMAKSNKKPLVVEMQDEDEDNNKKNKKKNQQAPIKKGFLNSAKAKKTALLYPEGSTEGVTKKTIWDRCQVVNMNDPSTMPPSIDVELSTTKVVKQEPKSTKTDTVELVSEFDRPKKEKEGQEEQHRRQVVDDSMFTRLAEEMDDDLLKSNVMSNSHGGNNGSVFGTFGVGNGASDSVAADMLAGVLGGGGDEDSEEFLRMLPLLGKQLGVMGDHLGKNTTKEPKAAVAIDSSLVDVTGSSDTISNDAGLKDTSSDNLREVEWVIKRLKAKGKTDGGSIDVANGNGSNDTTRGLEDVASPNRSISTTGGLRGVATGQKLRLRADLAFLPADANVDVEVGDACVRLSVSAVYKSIEMNFPGKIDRTSAVAKLKRKKGVLEVHATLLA